MSLLKAMSKSMRKDLVLLPFNIQGAENFKLGFKYIISFLWEDTFFVSQTQLAMDGCLHFAEIS